MGCRWSGAKLIRNWYRTSSCIVWWTATHSYNQILAVGARRHLASRKTPLWTMVISSLCCCATAAGYCGPKLLTSTGTLNLNYTIYIYIMSRVLYDVVVADADITVTRNVCAVWRDSWLLHKTRGCVYVCKVADKTVSTHSICLRSWNRKDDGDVRRKRGVWMEVRHIDLVEDLHAVSHVEKKNLVC